MFDVVGEAVKRHPRRSTGQQGVSAVLAGGLVDALPVGTAMAALAAASLVVSLALTPVLRRAADAATPSRGT